MRTLAQPVFKRKIKTAAQPPLGILPKDRPAVLHVALNDFTSVRIDKETGEILAPDDSAQTRTLRYIRQSAARRLLPEHRVSWCLRRNIEGEKTAILKNKTSGKAHFAGLISCGRIWACPVCASKVSNRRREELAHAVKMHRANGNSLLLVTYTFAHGRLDSLPDTLERLKKAWDAMVASKTYKSIRAAHGLIGTVRALEITHGSNGWHPHFHQVWFLEGLSSATFDAIRTRLFKIWHDQCIKKGLGAPSEKYGIDVRDGSYADTYISKWGIEDELTKANVKKGRDGGRAPFQLLDSYIDGDKQAGALYIEYVNAFKKSQQLNWSKGLKKLFCVGVISDEEIAAKQEENSDRLGVLTLDEWRFILRFRSLRRDLRAEVLEQAERYGMNAVRVYLEIQGFVETPSKIPIHILESNRVKQSPQLYSLALS